MMIRITIGCAPFTPRPNIRLQEILNIHKDIELVKNWDISAENATKSFGDWYWEVIVTDDSNYNESIMKKILNEIRNFYNDGKIRCGGVEYCY